MNEAIARAVAELNARVGNSFDGSATFVIEGEGTIVVDQSGARPGDTPTEVSLIADAETFRQILSGDLDPTSAFMQGRLRVEGDMGAAMRLGAAIA